MKNIILNNRTSAMFLGELKKLIENSQSIVFPTEGVITTGSKFGSLRKNLSNNPHMLTTKKVEICLVEDGIRISNPLNKGFGYSDIVIPFGTLVSAYNSFFWKDEWGYWRQMKFSKVPGWALLLSGGRATTQWSLTY